MVFCLKYYLNRLKIHLKTVIVAHFCVSFILRINWLSMNREKINFTITYGDDRRKRDNLRKKYSKKVHTND